MKYRLAAVLEPKDAKWKELSKALAAGRSQGQHRT